jgi:hypothetical protein
MREIAGKYLRGSDRKRKTSKIQVFSGVFQRPNLTMWDILGQNYFHRC